MSLFYTSIFSVSQPIDFKFSLFTFKALHNLFPTYVTDLLHSYNPSCFLQSSSSSCYHTSSSAQWVPECFLCVCNQTLELPALSNLDSGHTHASTFSYHRAVQWCFRGLFLKKKYIERGVWTVFSLLFALNGHV